MLLQSGAAAVNRLDYAGRTALTLASLGPNVDVKKTLLSHGADVNLRGNDFEHTPLMTAVVWSTCEIVTILIEHGADIKLTTRRLGTIDSAWSLARDRDDASIAALATKCIRQSDAKSRCNWCWLRCSLQRGECGFNRGEAGDARLTAQVKTSMCVYL
jgi:hypothetical protein